MREGLGGRVAVAIACLALFVALGGTVYAAKRIDGHSIKVKSLPGNRLAIRSVPGNRLRPGTIPGSRLARGSVTGAQVDASTLGRVPSATHATRADSATEAGTALHAVGAVDAQRVNGYAAGCGAGTRHFAGACWQVSHQAAPVAADAAARACADQGGELPEALALAAFALEPGISLAEAGEWSSDIPVVSGEGVFAVVTVSATGEIDSSLSTVPTHYRCVLPLLG